MKKATGLLAAAAGIILIIVIAAGANAGRSDAEYIRIHIRANSNLESDQRVKYAVKDAVVDYLAPYLAEAKTYSESMKILRARLSGVEGAAGEALQKAGKGYSARAELAEEEFPARAYDGLTLDGGVYDALIIRLGSGAGDNWWCVVYPPLCFVNAEGTGDVTYKSKLLEIIREFIERNA